MATKMNYSFEKGLEQVTKKDYPIVRDKLKDLLGCKTSQHFSKRKKQFLDMPVHVKEEIDKIFGEYGITDPDEIWTITEVE